MIPVAITLGFVDAAFLHKLQINTTAIDSQQTRNQPLPSLDGDCPLYFLVHTGSTEV